MDGKTIETHFQYLEVVNMLTVQQMQEQAKPKPSMAYWQGAKANMEVGNIQGRGKLMEVHEKKFRFRPGQAIKGKIPPIEETFKSVVHIFDGKVGMIDEEAYNEATSNWIRQAEPNEELKN